MVDGRFQYLVSVTVLSIGLLLSGCTAVRAKEQPAATELSITAEASEESPICELPPSESEPMPETAEDYDLVFYFGAAVSGDYEYAIAPEGGEEWISLSSGCCGTCENGDPYGYLGVSVPVGKYGLDFSVETGKLWQLRAVDAQSGALYNCWHSIPILDDRTRLTLVETEADGGMPWLGQTLLVVDAMQFCKACPESWGVQPADLHEPEQWSPLAFTGEIMNPFVLSHDAGAEEEGTRNAEPEGIHLQPDSSFDAVLYASLTMGDACQYYFAPEGQSALEQPMVKPRPEGSPDPAAGACFNDSVNGLHATRWKYQFDFGGRFDGLWQLRVAHNELVFEDGETVGTYHNIPLTGTDTALIGIWLPNSALPGARVLLVTRMQFCEDCPKGWQVTNGK